MPFIRRVLLDSENRRNYTLGHVAHNRAINRHTSIGKRRLMIAHACNVRNFGRRIILWPQSSARAGFFVARVAVDRRRALAKCLWSRRFCAAKRWHMCAVAWRVPISRLPMLCMCCHLSCCSTCGVDHKHNQHSGAQHRNARCEIGSLHSAHQPSVWPWHHGSATNSSPPRTYRSLCCA